ncbi:GntR family transcriptional regulator [Streptomyces sp. HNA39]|jgi:DNA-binding GntR family transcriptional regulator|uniref:GntR family transcriptional regulator n=1 Tax=Streptomyces sp. HNA39 TaxID=2850561 RepID=UPI00200DE1FC|nr:GntR family transcriptional regulator [Streptomyces sp. HNA39]UQA37494.1 GntR family transcriptional regulator [Streptomyces sp. HNA39]
MTEGDDIRNLDRRGPELVYAAVADAVAAQIASGELKSGDRIPGELEMAATYGIARMTVARAVRELRERGLVQTVRGKGTFVL